MQERLEHALQSRLEWWDQRQTASWEPKAGQDVHMPTGGEVIGRLFGIRPKKDKEKEIRAAIEGIIRKAFG